MGIERANCVSEGKKSKNLPKMADFCHFFLITEEQMGAEPPTGGKCPSCPPPLMTPLAYEWAIARVSEKNMIMGILNSDIIDVSILLTAHNWQK